jgi:hypothetical protein
MSYPDPQGSAILAAPAREADNPPPEIKQLKELKERVWLLEEVVRELLIYASATPKDLYSPGGYTSELVPRLTRIGAVKVVERLAAIRGLVTESPEDPSKKVET